MENHNTLRVTPGCFEVNGNAIDCVADFKCEGFAFGLARVTLTFDVPFERCMIGSEPQNPVPDVTYEHRRLFSSEPHDTAPDATCKDRCADGSRLFNR